MTWIAKRRPLLTHFLWRIVLPVAGLIAALISLGVLLNQRLLANLVTDRDLLLATVLAGRIDDAVQTRIDLLALLAESGDTRARLEGPRATGDAPTLVPFDAGIRMIVFHAGVLTRRGDQPALSSEMLRTISKCIETQRPVVGNIDHDSPPGTNAMISFAVPVLGEVHTLYGVLVGSTFVSNTTLSASLQQVAIGRSGIAYVVDGNGRVLFHPSVDQVGADYTDRPFVRDVILGTRGATVFAFPQGEQIVAGFVPLRHSGWGLVFREPWADATEPGVQIVRLSLAGGLLCLLLIVWLIFIGIGSVRRPIDALSLESTRLSQNLPVGSLQESRITELDQLSRTFANMAHRLEQYRHGLRRYAQSITQTQESERLRLSHELHDDTIQRLMLVSRELEPLRRASSPEVVVMANQAMRSITESVDGLRRLCRDLRPPVLEDLGLAAALQSLVRDSRHGPGAVPTAELVVSGDAGRPDHDTELVLFRIAQEALTNVRKYASATGVRVNLTHEATATRLSVRDDGAGFSAPANFAELAAQGHFGLMGMQERIVAVGGMVTLQTAPRRGTTIEVSVPIRAPAA